SGGPLVHLHTGEIIGVQQSGQWVDIKEGKYAYSLPTKQFFDKTKALMALQNLAMNQRTMDGLIAALPSNSVAQVAASSFVEATETTTSDINTKPTKGYDPEFLSGATVELPQMSPGILDTAVQNGKVFDYQHFSIVMNQERRFAVFAAANVDGSTHRRVARHRVIWRFDPRVPKDTQANNDLFRHNLLDRGSLVRRTSVTWGTTEAANEASTATFHYTNVVPQYSILNQRSWLQLEDFILNPVIAGELRASIFTGPVFRDDDPEYRGYMLPRSFWKIAIIDFGEGDYRVLSYVLSQDLDTRSDDLDSISIQTFDPITTLTPVREIEALTGLDFGRIKDYPVGLLKIQVE
ncbi:MAG: DNA/RNA non-specific endonuclease, partial [Planctomycetota bacterium]